MPIERISFRDGLPLAETDLESQIKKIIEENYPLKETLSEGDYNIGPSRLEYRHNLIVFANDTALYRALPLQPEFGTVIASKERVEGRLGGRSIRIPQDQDIFVITSQFNMETLALFEIIFHSSALVQMDTFDTTLIVPQYSKN